MSARRPGLPVLRAGALLGLLSLLGSIAVERDLLPHLERDTGRRTLLAVANGENLALGRGFPRHSEAQVQAAAGHLALRADLYADAWSAVDWAAAPPGASTATLVTRGADDVGLGLVHAAATRLSGAARPLLATWFLIALGCAVAAWAAFELAALGHAAAAGLFLAALGASLFVRDQFLVAYAAAGYYLVAALAALAFLAFLERARFTARDLAARAFAAGLVLALCAACRAPAAVFAAGCVLGALARLRRDPRRFFLATAVLAAPLVLWLAWSGSSVPGPGKVAHRHAVWHGLWVGLGDFGGARGYDGADASAYAYARSVRPGLHWSDAEYERVLEAKILRDVFGAPWWSAGIAARRAAETLLQTRTWFGPPADPPVLAAYYGLSAEADRFRPLGIVPLTVPVPFVIALLLWAAARRPAALKRRARLLGAFAAALAVFPVAVSTLSALEVQTFALVYWLAAAFLGEELWHAR